MLNAPECPLRAMGLCQTRCNAHANLNFTAAYIGNNPVVSRILGAAHSKIGNVVQCCDQAAEPYPLLTAKWIVNVISDVIIVIKDRAEISASHRPRPLHNGL